jgi:hypothetical protein
MVFVDLLFCARARYVSAKTQIGGLCDSQVVGLRGLAGLGVARLVQQFRTVAGVPVSLAVS